MKRLLTTIIPAFILVLTAGMSVQAQSYYDDDIYYDASKAKKEKQEKARQAAREAARRNYVPSQPVTDYPAADTYDVNSGSTRDVDEYNRRYSLESGREETDSISLDQLLAGDFVNTRRIERFSNPDIVSGSDDEELKDYYYSEASQPQTTVIINTVDPWAYGAWSNPWYYGGYYSPYSWRYGWAYDPWYYGPSWSWSWGWGPSWSWSWGGWHGGWHGPGHWHGPGWGPSWSGNHWRPTSPGASMPHRPGGVTPSTPGRRPGNSYYGNGSGTRYNYGSGSNATVPGSRVNGTAGRRPSTVNGTTSGSGSRPSSVGNSSSGNRNNSTVPGSRVNNRSGRSNTNSYNNNSNWNSNSNSNWNSGTRNSGGSSWGGGGRSSGGGGGRSSGGGRSGRH